MSSSSSSDIPLVPPCGLYKTSAPVPGHEERVPKGRLVYFHNHSQQGSPIVLLPAENQHNTWRFHKNGYRIDDIAYARTLQPRLEQGLYRLREHFHPDAENTVARNALVQLGYTVDADPILFFGTMSASDGALHFPNRGMKIDETVYQLLDPLDLRGPHMPTPRHLH